METAQRVASDLEAIFGAGPSERTEAPGRRARVRAVGPRGSGRARFVPATLGAILAAGFVGLATGSLLAEPIGLGRPAETSTVAYDSGEMSSGATTLTPPGLTPQAPDVAPLQQLAAPKPRPPRVLRAKLTRSTPAPAIRQDTARCVRRSAKRCSHSDMLAADRQLRHAYARAISAGVPRPILVDYRNRWARLRRTTSDHPSRLVDAYGDLASDLDRTTKTSRGYQRRRS